MVEVNSRNINYILRKHEYISIVFFSPRDYRSKSMFTPYKNASIELSEQNITVGAVNGPENYYLLR